MIDQIVAMLRRVDEMGHAETLAPLLVIVQIDPDDHVRPDHPEALNNVQADAAKSEDDSVASRLGLGCIDYRADAGCHAAADIADLVKRASLSTLASAIPGRTVKLAKVEVPM